MALYSKAAAPVLLEASPRRAGRIVIGVVCVRVSYMDLNGLFKISVSVSSHTVIDPQ